MFARSAVISAFFLFALLCTCTAHAEERALPSVAFDRPSEGTNVSTGLVELEGTASDVTGISIVEFSIDFGAWMRANGTSSWYACAQLSDGAHSVSVKATASNGGITIVTVNFAVDTVLPYFAIDYVPSLTNKTSLTLTGNGEPSSTISCGNANARVGANGRFAITVALSSGMNTLDVNATDGANNVFSRRLQIMADFAAPSLNVQAVPHYSTTVDIVIAGTVEVGAAVTVNGANAYVSSGMFSATVLLAEGANSIAVVAKDVAGNQNAQYFVVIYDGTAPALAVTPEAVFVRGDRVNVTGQTEAGASITIKGVEVDVSPDGTFTANVGGLVPGVNSIIVRAEDPAGNLREATLKITRDSAATFSMLSPQDNSATTYSEVQVMGVAELGAKVTVNGANVSVGTDGTFSRAVDLAMGENFITIKVVDPLGNEATQRMRVVREAQGGPGNSDESALQKLVIPVGILLAGTLAAVLIVVYAMPEKDTFHSTAYSERASRASYTAYPQYMQYRDDYVPLAMQADYPPTQPSQPSPHAMPAHPVEEQTIITAQQDEPPSYDMSAQDIQEPPPPAQPSVDAPIPNTNRPIEPISLQKGALTTAPRQDIDDARDVPRNVPEKVEMRVEEHTLDAGSAPEIKLEITSEHKGMGIPLEISRIEHDVERTQPMPDITMPAAVVPGASEPDLDKRIESEIDAAEKEVNRVKGLGLEVAQAMTLIRLARSLLRSKNHDKASQYAKKATNIALEIELRAKLEENQ